MADNVEIEFTEQNPTIVEVLVENTVTNIDVTVEAPTSPQVIEVHVDVNSAQVAIDAANAAEAILAEIEELIGSIPEPVTPNLPQVLAQGDRTIRLTDGDGETHLELDDRGKLVFNAEADFLYLTTGIFPVNTVLKIYNAGTIDLFGIFTGDYWGVFINGMYIDEFTGITLKPGTAILKKLDDGDGSMEQWLLTYEISDFSKEALDLGFVDNTADINKPVSNPQAAAIKHLNSLTVHLAVDVNVSTLSGVMIIQGWGTRDSVPILLMAQTDQTQNGLWITKYDGAWTRPYQHYLIGLTIFSLYVSRGTYSGRTFQYSYGLPGSLIGLSEVVDSKLKSGIGTDTKSSMSQKAITDELALRDKRVIKITTPSSAVTVTTAETQVTSYNFEIEGNTYTNGDILRVSEASWFKAGTNNASTFRLKLSNTNDYATATNVLILAASGGNINLKGKRSYNVKTGQLKGLMSPAANGIFNDNIPTNLPTSTIPLDWTQKIYGFVSLQVTNGSDAANMESLVIEKI